MHARFFQILKKEPLIHFFLIGSLLLILNSIFQGTNKPKILLSNLQARQMYQEQADMLGRPLEKADSAQIINSFFEEEILVREAYEQGLDQYDERIRKRLVEKMRVLLYGKFDEPSDKDLRTYYETHKDQYQISKSKSFRHIFFSPTNYQQVEDKTGILKQLKDGQAAESIGEDFPEGAVFHEKTRFDLIRDFGMSFANTLDQADSGVWIGPITSKHGTHFIKVIDIQGLEYLPYDAVKSYLVNDYVQELQEQSFLTKFDSIKQKYTLEIEVEGTK